MADFIKSESHTATGNSLPLGSEVLTNDNLSNAIDVTVFIVHSLMVDSD